jgi:hypothetical protein
VNERDLEAQAKRLGEQEAERLDVERVVARVTQRLRSGEQVAEVSRFVQVRWLRIAATVVVLVGGGLVVRDALQNGEPAAAATFVADDLTDLSTDELQQILGTLDEIVTPDSTAVLEGEDLNGLNAEQLRALLRSLEG